MMKQKLKFKQNLRNYTHNVQFFILITQVVQFIGETLVKNWHTLEIY